MGMTTKERIAQIAFSMFLEKGYQNTTIREIAQECGFSHVNVLRHYNSKGELAIHFVEMYINTLLQETKKQAAHKGIKPSAEYSDLYWLMHYSFMKDHTSFARFYCNTYAEMRDAFYCLLAHLSKRGHVITEDLIGIQMVAAEAEADLYSKLIVDADLHTVEMLAAGKIEPVWAVQNMTKLAQLLLLRRSEEQITDTAQGSKEALQDAIENGVKFIESELFHKY